MENRLSPEEFKRLAQEMIEKLGSMTAQTSRGNMPYYNRSHAEWVRKVINEVLASKKHVFIPLGKLSPETLKQKWYQGRKYLIEVLSFDREMADRVVANRKKDGLVVALRASAVFPEAAPIVDWRAEVLEFIQNSNHGEIRTWENIPINEDDYKWLENMLKPLGIFVYDIGINKIRILRYEDNRGHTKSSESPRDSGQGIEGDVSSINPESKDAGAGEVEGPDYDNGPTNGTNDGSTWIL